ncbi:MAG: DUF3667 domain-containing protein [Bacteroidota bacterium]
MKHLFKRKPGQPQKVHKAHDPGPCLNCSTYLGSHDLFCPHCGQKRIEHEDMSFSHLIGESFLDYFHFDSKFFRTIRPLLFRPGRLTMEFMNGKRKSYLEPFKLFLVISVIYFLLLPLNGDSSHEKGTNEATRVAGVSGNANHLKPYTYTLKGSPISFAGQDSIRREIDTIGVRGYVDKHFGEYGWVYKLLMRQGFKILAYSGQSFSTVLEHTASKMIFLLIPVFALLLKLVYLRRKRLYFEHLVFSLHAHAFVFLLMTMVLLIEFFVPVRMLYLVVISLVYLFFALKFNYGEGTGKTSWKLLILTLLYCIIALPVFMAMLILVALFLA